MSITTTKRRKSSVGVHQRQEASRHRPARRVRVFTVTEDNAPGIRRGVNGLLQSISVEGMGFGVPSSVALSAERMLIGVEGDGGVLYYATVVICGTEATSTGVHIQSKFADADHDVIHHDNLMPRYEPSTHQFSIRLSSESLEPWVMLGVLRPKLVDRVLVCRKCAGVATFGTGCQACGSVRTAVIRMIHHFACAHVDSVPEFEQDGTLVCPKCRTRNLVVGADFEYLDGPYHCFECDGFYTAQELVGSCMRCGMRFPVREALEKELIGYDVDRLDPLAFIAAP